jgi:beta-glucosidase
MTEQKDFIFPKGFLWGASTAAHQVEGNTTNDRSEWEKSEKPVYITENGLADAGDVKRPWFIVETLKRVHRAIENGVDVRGYLHWSLMDNFEWGEGFWPRFGLVEIDYKTLERKMRPSAYLYRDICLHNGVMEKLVEKYKNLL